MNLYMNNFCRLERRKEQQIRAQKDNQEFLALIDGQLEQMEQR